MTRKQRGFSLLFVGIILLLVIGSILAFLGLFGSSHGGATIADTTTRLQKAQAALEQYASVSGRLPCPANPTLDTGDEDGGGTAGACNSVPGTIPWRTIGLRHDDGLDAWGLKISYRLYTGAAGSLTQTNGASMVLCTIGAPASPGLAPGGLCQVDGGGHHSDRNEFVAGKGLIVTDFGVVHTDTAYVLISHGPSGRGAFTSSGTQSPLPSSAAEIANTTATGSFVARSASPAGIGVDDPNFFDDILVYRSIFGLATNANIAARNWTDPTYASVLANTSAVTAALAAAGVTPAGTNLQTQTLAFNNATVSATRGGTAENLSLSNAAGLDGIGGFGGAGPPISSADNEILHVTFTNPAQVFAVTLNGFGCRMTGTVCTDSDAVQFTFFNGATPVGSPITKNACNTLSVASYTIDLGTGGDFDSVDITPLPTNPAAGVTQFLVGGFVNCPEGVPACITGADTGSGPGGNHCP